MLNASDHERAIIKLFSVIRPGGERVDQLTPEQECVYRYYHASLLPLHRRTYGMDGFGLSAEQRYSCSPEQAASAERWLNETYPEIMKARFAALRKSVLRRASV